MNRLPACIPALALVLMILVARPCVATEEPEPATEAPRAAHSLLLDIIRAGERWVAVGDRGHVLISDNGVDWRQAREVPVRATLTRVTFAGGRLWAVGHDTTIIHSRDMGETWQLQNFEPERETPLLDVKFLTGSQGLAVGAYGLVMMTDDAGETWEAEEMIDLVTSEAIEWPEGYDPDDFNDFDDGAWDDDESWDDDEAWEDEGDDWTGQADDDAWEDDDAWGDDDFYDADADFDAGCYEFKECHLNGMTRLDGDRLFMVAERGFGYRSEDGGQTWEAIRFPYPGSMFGVVNQSDCLVAFGLRGHIQKSCDFGDSWEILETGSDSSLMGATVRSDGTVVMVASDGAIVALDEDGSIRSRQHRRGSDLAAVAEGPDGLILVGEDGIQYE